MIFLTETKCKNRFIYVRFNCKRKKVGYKNVWIFVPSRGGNGKYHLKFPFWLLAYLPNFKLWVIRVPVAEQVIGLLKSDLPTSGSLGDNNLPGNTPTVWAFWDWLCRTVMSPLAVLAVQPSLFPYFHVRNNEIYSLTEEIKIKIIRILRILEAW